MENKQKETQKPEAIPFFVYESEQMRKQVRERRHWIAHAAMLLAILFIVGGFIWYLSQYDFVSNEEVTLDGASGNANYIGKDGAIYNGTGFSTQVPDTNQEERQVEGNP